MNVCWLALALGVMCVLSFRGVFRLQQRRHRVAVEAVSEGWLKDNCYTRGTKGWEL